MTEAETARQTTETLTAEALKSWNECPKAYKAMIGGYVNPLVAVILAMNSELNLLNGGEL